MPHVIAIHFTKMHGLGNDFIVVDCRDGIPAPPDRMARAMCPRRTAVGADGLIAICPSDRAVIRMRIFNADGSEAEMCGNGIRCAAWYAGSLGLTDDFDFDIETKAGLRHVRFLTCNRVAADMGLCSVCPAESLDVEDFGSVEVIPASTGNPHCVTFVDDVATAPVTTLGPRLERHRRWPEGANVEFVSVAGPGRLDVRVWERGVGETDACGTGACAAALAAAKTGRCAIPCEVRLPGGTLTVDRTPSGSLLLTGPVAKVYIGTYYLYDET